VSIADPYSDRTFSVLMPRLNGWGSERFALNITRGLAERGLNVDLVLLDSAGEFADQVAPGVNLVELGIPDLRTRSSIRKLSALMGYLRRTRPALLLSIYDTLNLAGIAQRLTGVDTKILVRLPVHLSAEFSTKGWKGRLQPYLMRLTYYYAHGVITPSQGVAEDVLHLLGRHCPPVQVINNPTVTPDLFQKAQVPLDHPWFQPGEPPVIVSVGRLEEQKDFLTLIRAFAQVRRQCKARLVIVGEGSDRPKVENCIQELGLVEDVCLVGYRHNPYPYMANAQVFVLSSFREGFCNALAEAMALGIPLVATDCKSSPAEILANGQYGHLVAIGDEDGMAQAILESLDHPIAPNILRKRAEAYSLDRITDQYIEVLNRYLAPSMASTSSGLMPELPLFGGASSDS
jgi:glycosyltransferase involved in cell wall biosynthesis